MVGHHSERIAVCGTAKRCQNGPDRRANHHARSAPARTASSSADLARRVPVTAARIDPGTAMLALCCSFTMEGAASIPWPRRL